MNHPSWKDKELNIIGTVAKYLIICLITFFIIAIVGTNYNHISNFFEFLKGSIKL